MAANAKPPEISVRIARAEDRAAALALRNALWKDAPVPELDNWFATGRLGPFDVAVVFIARIDGLAAGYAEATARPYAEGCRTSPVAYLEGWYVDTAHRRKGVGGALVAAVKDWARGKGLVEIASDTEIGNSVSAEAHRALGFVEDERIICFRADL